MGGWNRIVPVKEAKNTVISPYNQTWDEPSFGRFERRRWRCREGACPLPSRPSCANVTYQRIILQEERHYLTHSKGVASSLPLGQVDHEA